MPKGMRGRSGKVAKETDLELAEDELSLLQRSSVDIAALRPRISDAAQFDLLCRTVDESKKANESIAALKVRLEALGGGCVKVIKEVCDLLK